MVNIIKQLFRLGPKVDHAELAKQGALIPDARSKGEYAGGHIRSSINISVDTLNKNLSKLKDKNKPIITCCAPGMRSAAAKNILKSNGYTRVYNGGSRISIQNKIM